MVCRRFEPERAVEIVGPAYGSGYRIGGRLVLTAAHLFPAGVGSGCQVRSKKTFGTVAATVAWIAPGMDIALVELPADVAGCDPVAFGALPAGSEIIRFDLYGWPTWARTTRPDEKPKAGGRHIDGLIYLADTSPDGLLVLEPGRIPEAPAPGEGGSAWQGISGAAVVCDGLVVAVQRQHQNPRRPASLEAEPLAKVYGDQGWRRLLKKHGVPAAPDKPFFDALSEALEAAYQRRDDLLATGQDTSAVEAEILDLKRRRRAGPQLKVGDFLLDGRFRLLERLGHGGFATIWKSLDRKRHEVVAIKVLHGQYADDRTRRDRFFRGARQMATLRHPGIVRVLEERLEEEGYFFFVMEYLPGGDFHRAVLQGLIARADRLTVIAAVGEALQFAHERGIIHRDIKPANIVLDQFHRPKLTDFDLVRALDTTGGTRTGALGSWVYAAPELMTRPQDAGAPADVYGLGMTAVFALYGADLPYKVVRDPVGFVQTLDASPAIKRVLQRAIHWDWEKRYPAISKFTRALRLVAPLRLSAPDSDKEQSDRSLSLLLDEGKGDTPKPTQPTLFHDSFPDGALGPAMIWLPGGTFRMGQDDSSYEVEKPAHEVEVSGFSIGQYPVTFEDYDRFCEATRRRKPSDWKWGRATRPVIDVSWEDATAYCKWLSEQAGVHYRLPTEAEWEYACRASSKTEYCFGDDERRLGDYAWYSTNSEDKTHPVGVKRANVWDLHDMHGNVLEWVQDWYANDYYRQSPRENPTGPESGSDRVVRGGSWYGDAVGCRSAYRSRLDPGYRFSNLGFRLARTGPWPFNALTLARQRAAEQSVRAESEAERKPAYQAYDGFRDRLKDGAAAPEMVYLPGGTFKMGDIQEKGPQDERPVHKVTLDAFAMGRYPVTVGEFRRFVDATGYQTEAERGDGAYVYDGKEWGQKTDAHWRNPYFPQEDAHPVVCLGWNDATAYCEWLSEQTREQYSLPTEAEWEYACRASSEAEYCFGNDEQRLGEYAWYSKNSEGKTHPVGQKRANAWGLHDVHGNVWEWVRDWYGAYPEGSRSGAWNRALKWLGASPKQPQRNPSGPESGSGRVVRGGSWYDVAVGCRSAFRRGVGPGLRVINLGFRLARHV